MACTVLIVGAGGFGQAVADALRLCPQFELIGFVDDRYPDLTELDTVPVVGPVAALIKLRARADAVVVAIGNVTARRAAFEQARALGYRLPPLVHPHAYVAASARIGAGAIVMAGAVISSAVVLGEGCLVNAGAIVDHDCLIGRFSHIGIAASLGGGAKVAEGAWLRQGAVLLSGHIHEG